MKLLTLGAVVLLAACMEPGDGPRIIECAANPARTPVTGADADLVVFALSHTVTGAQPDSFHFEIAFRVASTELFGGVPVEGATIALAVREGTAEIASVNLTTDENGLAATTGTFERPRVVIDATATLPGGGEANDSPAAVCLQIVNPSVN